MTKTFSLWYRFDIVTVDALAGTTISQINVLGFTQADCVNIAMQSLDPGQMLGGMEHMGTATDYYAVCGEDGDESLIWDDDDRIAPGENNIVPTWGMLGKGREKEDRGY